MAPGSHCVLAIGWSGVWFIGLLFEAFLVSFFLGKMRGGGFARAPL